MDNEKLGILANHYRDTFGEVKATLGQRSRVYIVIVGFVTLLATKIFVPEIAANLVNTLSAEKLGLSEPLDFRYVQSLIWFMFALAIVRYIQTHFSVQRLYAYLHALEETLNDAYADDVSFTREGKAYLEHRPEFVRWIRFLYVPLTPIIIFVVMASAIFSEFVEYGCKSVFFWFDTTVFSFISASLWLYVKSTKDD